LSPLYCNNIIEEEEKMNMPMRPRRFLLLSLTVLISTTNSFVPHSSFTSKNLLDITREFDVRLRLSGATLIKSTLSDHNHISVESSPFPETRYEEDDDDGDDHCLELDPIGQLRLSNQSDILMQGLDPKVWSFSRPANGDTHALFLHTLHRERKPAHETSLGSLISCRRLLACARK